MFDEPAIKLVCERLTVFGSEVGRAVNSLAAAAKLIANVPHRQSLTNVARGIKSTSWINSFSAFCDFGGPIKSNVIYQLMTAGLVRDSQPFCEARFSCQELIRFLGIALDWATAAPLARMAAHQRNVFWGRRVGIRVDWPMVDRKTAVMFCRTWAVESHVDTCPVVSQEVK